MFPLVFAAVLGPITHELYNLGYTTGKHGLQIQNDTTGVEVPQSAKTQRPRCGCVQPRLKRSSGAYNMYIYMCVCRHACVYVRYSPAGAWAEIFQGFSTEREEKRKRQVELLFMLDLRRRGVWQSEGALRNGFPLVSFKLLIWAVLNAGGFKCEEYIRRIKLWNGRNRIHYFIIEDWTYKTRGGEGIITVSQYVKIIAKKFYWCYRRS